VLLELEDFTNKVRAFPTIESQIDRLMRKPRLSNSHLETNTDSVLFLLQHLVQACFQDVVHARLGQTLSACSPRLDPDETLLFPR
jgi:predicted HAD superfamily hydrolase